MNRWQDSLIDFIPVLAFMVTIDMLRSILAPELEKKLRRKLTDWDWWFYLQESYRRAKTESRQQIVKQWWQWLVDMKIIHDFVWEQDKGEFL
jgi:hypothetical protein